MARELKPSLASQIAEILAAEPSEKSNILIDRIHERIYKGLLPPTEKEMEVWLLECEKGSHGTRT